LPLSQHFVSVKISVRAGITTQGPGHKVFSHKNVLKFSESRHFSQKWEFLRRRSSQVHSIYRVLLR